MTQRYAHLSHDKLLEAANAAARIAAGATPGTGAGTPPN
jgi:hypothetical protein